LGRAQEKLSAKEELAYKNTLLVIDDDVAALGPIKRFLEKEGYEVFTAPAGKKGCRSLKKQDRCLITDINMPDMNGIQVLQNAKKFYQDIEGIVVTGQKDEVLAIEALRAGALDYITKTGQS